MPALDPATAAAIIDLAAYRHNLAALGAVAAPAQVLAVVKADGYGHGMLPCAAAARESGATWLGVATLGEALQLRAAGDKQPTLCWLYGPEEDFSAAVAAQVDLGISSVAELQRVVRAAQQAGRTANVHLKIDTGLSRNGCSAGEWEQLCQLAHRWQQSQTVQVRAVWSHLAAGDQPEHPSLPRQLQRFDAAMAVARAVGLNPKLTHLANSAAALSLPAARRDLVRVGIAAFGVDPGGQVADAAGVKLRPVMTLRAQLVQVKRLAAGESVSYGHTWTADQDTTVGLVPLGYADGIPRHASNRAQVWVGGRRAPIRGVVCMDQFVVDLGPQSQVSVGAEVVLFGDSAASAGVPTAQDWASWCDTIGYEIVTRIGPRVPRIWHG